MAGIVAHVKLPERHEFRASADSPLPPAPSTPPMPRPTAPAQESAHPDTARAQNDAGLITPLRTLRDDLQSVVQEKKISYVRAVALEEKKRQERGEAISAPATRAHYAGVVTAAAVLALLGALALGAVWYVASQRTPQAARPLSASFIFSESAVPFSLSGMSASDVKRSLAQARSATGIGLGAITRIVPLVPAENAEGSERPATFEEFFTALGVSAPSDLYRALAEEFFFGIHTVDENAPVIIIPVTAYERAFSAMLEWEKNMNADLAPLFTQVPALTLDENNLPTERVFTDMLMRNYDVRVLKNDEGVVELFYSFPTRNILIIAESPYSFTEALARLRAERRL